MSQQKHEKYARMANQIGEYFAPRPADEAAMGVALHVRSFWTPKMIAETLAAIDAKEVSLNETTRSGFVILAKEMSTAS